MKTKLQVKREEAGLTIIGLALKMCKIDQSFHMPFLVETLVGIETDGADSDGTGILVRVAAQALNCSVDDLVEG